MIGGGEKMKKKMTVLGGLLLAALVSAYSVCGTYAKYISSIDFADEARVAKWDFKVNGENPAAFNNFDIDLFKESYEIKGIDHQFVVSSEPGVKVVAPGTEGEYALALTGTAETNYTVLLDNVEVENTIKTTDKDGNEYSPIKFSLTVGGTARLTDVSIDDLKAELEKLYDGQAVYPANHTLNEELVISWKWAFEQDTNVDEYDALDTYLAQEQGTVSVKFGVTITQTQAEATVDTNNTTLATTINTKIDSADLKTLKSWGYDAALSRNVKSEVTGDTLALTGSINFTSKDEGFSSNVADRTGFYYPVTIKATQDSTITFSQNPTKTKSIKAGESLTILYALDSESATKQSTITIADNNGNTQIYTVDYTGLNFIK